MKTLYSYILQIKQDLQYESILDDQEEIIKGSDSLPEVQMSKIAIVFDKVFDGELDKGYPTEEAQERFDSENLQNQELDMNTTGLKSYAKKFETALKKEKIQYNLITNHTPRKGEYSWYFEFKQIPNPRKLRHLDPDCFTIWLTMSNGIAFFEAPKQFFDSL